MFKFADVTASHVYFVSPAITIPAKSMGCYSINTDHDNSGNSDYDDIICSGEDAYSEYDPSDY